MMKMNNREEIYSYLKQYDREYSLAKTVKKEIEQKIMFVTLLKAQMMRFIWS